MTAICAIANARGACASDIRLTPWEIGHPDLPRDANALGSHVPGAFCFQRSRRMRMHRPGSFHSTTEFLSALEHPGSASARPEAGARLRPAHVRRVVMLRRERRGEWTPQGRIAPERIAGWRQPAMRSIDRTRYSGTGSCPVRCARRCRGVCRSVGEGVPRADESSEAEQRRKPLATGSNPVRPPLDSSDG